MPGPTVGVIRQTCRRAGRRASCDSQAPSTCLLTPLLAWMQDSTMMPLFRGVWVHLQDTHTHSTRLNTHMPAAETTLGLPSGPEFTKTHVHRVSDAIQPSHPLSSPSPPALNLSQHQGLFQCPRASPGTGRGDGAHREPLVEVGNAPGARQGRGDTGRPLECKEIQPVHPKGNQP